MPYVRGFLQYTKPDECMAVYSMFYKYAQRFQYLFMAPYTRKEKGKTIRCNDCLTQHRREDKERKHPNTVLVSKFQVSTRLLFTFKGNLFCRRPRSQGAVLNWLRVVYVQSVFTVVYADQSLSRIPSV